MNTSIPYENNLDYIAGAIDYLQQLAGLRRCLRRSQAEPEEPETDEYSDVDPEFWAIMGVDDDDDADDAPPKPSAVQQRRRHVDSAHRAWRERTEAALAAGTALPLEALANDYGLTEFEKLVILAVLGPDLDAVFGAALVEMAGQHAHSGEVRVILDLLCDDLAAKVRARRIFTLRAPLLANGLLRVGFSRDRNTESEFQSMDLEIPRHISSRILGEYDVDDELIAFSNIITPTIHLDDVVLPPGRREELLQLVNQRDRILARRREWGFDRLLSYGKGLVMLFSGPPGTGKTMLAHAIARETQHQLMLVDLRQVIDYSPHGFEENLERIFHEARLQQAIVFFDEADELFADRMINGAMPTLLREFEKMDSICILATNRRQVLDEALDRRILYKLELEVPPPDLRARIWQRHLPETAPVAEDVDVQGLAEQFEFAGGHIKNAVLLAMHAAAQRQCADARIRQADLLHGARRQRRNRLEAHADKLVPKVTLADVVLPADIMAEVRGFVQAARVRSTVYGAWGLGEKLSLGRGLTALFAGPSGVGKTMTAEAVAGELGRNLYPVQLASLLSEYVGRTAKNMAETFREAAEADALLFIDEADAIFGARLAEGNHHATYINRQVDTLLAEIERFNGICILASNRPEALDQAFERRLHWHIDFPLPDRSARAAIWQALLADAPLADDVDCSALAAHELTGGLIRNAVLKAAYAAAGAGETITMAHLQQAIHNGKPQDNAQAIGFKAG